MTTDLRFDAMGTACHLQVEGGPRGTIDQARARVLDLEQRWSRFLPDSDVSLLNGALGVPVEVSPETIRLIDTACVAWKSTDGLYDPTAIDSLVSLGYDRPFNAEGFGRPAAETYPAPGCAGIEIDHAAQQIRLPLYRRELAFR